MINLSAQVCIVSIPSVEDTDLGNTPPTEDPTALDNPEQKPATFGGIEASLRDNAGKHEYFLFMVRNRLYTKKKILLSVFATIEPTPLGKEEQIVGGIYTLDNDVVFLNETLEPVKLNGWTQGKALFHPDEKFEANPGDLPNISEKLTTTYGIALANLITVVYACEDKINYLNGQLGYGKLETAVIAALEEGKIDVEHLRRFLKSVTWATGIMPLFVAPTSEKSMTGAPGIKKRRNELLTEHKDSLDDPTTLAKIETELAGIDKDYLEGDVTEKFYKSGKAFNVTRKRMYGIFGGEEDITNPGKMVLVTNSLEEEWDVEQMPAMINSLRMGSFKRGAETALGGADFKDLSRIFQNVTISDKDCNSKVGKNTLVTEYNAKRMVGRYDMKGKVLTPTDTKALIGKRIIIRSPQSCQTPGTAFCKFCVGDAVASNPNSVGMLAANLGASLMLIMMGAMHGRALKLAKVNLAEVIR